MLLALELECDKGKTLAMALTQDLEPGQFKTGSQVIRNADQVGHDGAETRLSKTDQDIVLTNDSRCTLGEIERKRSLVGSQVATDTANQSVSQSVHSSGLAQ